MLAGRCVARTGVRGVVDEWFGWSAKWDIAKPSWRALLYTVEDTGGKMNYQRETPGILVFALGVGHQENIYNYSK